MLAKPNGFYSSDDLAMLSRVLEEALIVSVDGSKLSESTIQELISRLGNLIMNRFKAGETNPERLKAIAVESIQRR
jgi:sensor histidine kinase regulating citrate/malate metabolism